MIKITAKALLPGLVFLLLSAAALGGCTGTSVSSWEMDSFEPGKTTAAEVIAELGEPVAVDKVIQGDSITEQWTYVIRPKTVKELETYLEPGEELDKVVDLSKYLHKLFVYEGTVYVPFPFFITSLFVFNQNDILVQKNRVRGSHMPPCDPYHEDCGYDEIIVTGSFEDNVKRVMDNYITIYETEDVARLKEELIRIRDAKKQSGAGQKEPDPKEKSSSAK